MDNNIPFKATYIILCLAVFVITTRAGYWEGTMLVMMIPMILITFPSSLVVIFIFYIAILMVKYFHMLIPYESAFLYLLVWAIYVIVGYIQWFHLIPYLRKSIKK